jgi:hypothetical protein
VAAAHKATLADPTQTNLFSVRKCVPPREQEHAQTSCLQNNFFATTFEPDTQKMAASVDDG